MNKMSGIIKDIHSEDRINYILIETNGVLIHAITLELDAKFKINDTVNVVFRASDVILTNSNSDIVIENKLSGNVIGLTKGKLMSHVKINSSAGPISSVIATQSVSDNNIEVGMQLYATFKATSVSLVG